MKKITLSFLAVFLLIHTQAMAMLFELPDLNPQAIEKLTNEQLVSTYIDYTIERKASETFYSKAGFAPKEYIQFKKLLTYIVQIRQEMAKRQIDAPPVDEWLK
jgi:hypothetical protein